MWWTGILLGVIVLILAICLVPLHNVSVSVSFKKSSEAKMDNDSTDSNTFVPFVQGDYLCSDLYLALANDKDRIFVKTDFFHVGPVMWRGKLHSPKITDQLVISGQSDHHVTPEIAKQYPDVKHWFAINNTSLDPRIVTLPLGLTNDTDESNLHRIYGNQAVMKEIQKVPKSFVNHVYDNVHTKCVYMNFTPTHPSRTPVFNLFKDKPWVTIGKAEPTMEGRRKYLLDLKQHDFCLCPRGNGLDTHRLWESLYMDCIPIVEYDPAYSDFTDLPIYFIDKWEDVTPESLQQVKENYSKRVWNVDKLYFPYWKNRILNVELAKPNLSKSWVLIHVGPPLPSHALDCIQQLQTSDPTAPIIVVCEEDPGIKGIQYVPLSSIPVSSWRERFTKSRKLTPGFWTWTCMRLFVLHDLMEYMRLQNVIHIEYDNLIYFKINWFLSCLPEGVQWACTRLGSDRLLANVFFTKTPEPLRGFMEFVLSHTYPNEMRYLDEFHKQTAYKCFELPTTESHPNYSHFESIFDAAALGQCIGGVDPRNKPGNTVGFVNEDSPWPDLKPSWVTWNDGKPVFKNTWQIQNLHVHCKNLRQFL
jgi:hypothetical protein